MFDATSAFLLECDSTTPQIDKVLNDPENTLKHMNYAPPVFNEVGTQTQYGASNTTTLAVQTATASSAAAFINP